MFGEASGWSCEDWVIKGWQHHEFEDRVSSGSSWEGGASAVVWLEQEQGEREEKRSRVGRGGWRAIVLWEPTGLQHCVSSNNTNVDFFTTSTNISPIFSRIVPRFHYVLFCFVVHSLCSYCMSFQFLFTLSLFNSLTVSLISFLIVWQTSQLCSDDEPRVFET